MIIEAFNFPSQGVFDLGKKNPTCTTVLVLSFCFPITCILRSDNKSIYTEMNVHSKYFVSVCVMFRANTFAFLSKRIIEGSTVCSRKKSSEWLSRKIG